MKIIVNDEMHLSELHLADKAAIVEHLNEREIYDRTLRIPFPYTGKDADDFFARVAEFTQQQGQPTHFAIRDTIGALIGACGFVDLQVGKSHRAEIGYWLGKPFWGRGIMTAVVQRLCQHAVDEFGVLKISAQVSTFNPASARVLEKCGFVQEGLLRKHHMKDGKLIDVWLFALIK